MLRLCLYRQKNSLAILRLFAFSLRRYTNTRELKGIHTYRHHSCILSLMPLQHLQIIHKHWYSDDPSCIRINLPALSPTMETGTISKWIKKEGDKLNEGDVLAEIETDKATMSFETPHEGYLAKILIPEGTKNVAVGQLLCIIVEEEADIGKLKEECYATPTPIVPTPAVPIEIPTPVVPIQLPMPKFPPVSPHVGKRVFASPLAVKQAAQKGIDLKTLGEGTGLYGSIKAADLAKAPPISAVAATAALMKKSAQIQERTGVDLPISAIPNLLAMQFMKSKEKVPHFYVNADINLNHILVLHKKFNQNLTEDHKLSVNDFILKAAALACTAVPETNSSWMETFIREYKSVDINVAVYMPSGMVMPIIFEAEKKTLTDINRSLKLLIKKAEEQKLENQDLETGTFTVIYLGMYSISTFSAIIKPPQSCVLAVGAAEKRIYPHEHSTEGYQQAPFISATLSCDHRVVDGAKGAQWLQKFKQLLEDPHTMLL